MRTYFHSFQAVFTALSVSLAVRIASAGTFVFTAPEGECLPVLNETCRDFLSGPADQLDARLRDTQYFASFKKAGTRPCRARFAWAYRPDAGEKPPKHFIVTVRKADTGRIVRKLETDKSEITLDNFEIATAYILRASVCTERGKELFGADRPFRTSDLPPRVLNVEGVGNCRDIGGWIGEGGRRVKQGLVYRSQGLNSNADYHSGKDKKGHKITKPKRDWRAGKPRGTPESRRQCRATLGIRTELDLRRTTNELWGMSSSPLGSSVDWRPVPSSSYGGMESASARIAFARDFRTFLNRENYPILFHCIGGADRTGTLAYILNGLLGVSADDLERDYHFTAACMNHPWPMKATDKPCHIESFKKVLAKYPGATINERIRAYVLACGIKEAEIATFKAIMFGDDKPAKRDAYATFANAPSSERRELMRDDKFRDALHAMDKKWGTAATAVPRWFREAPNCRDLGGWPTKDGGRIRFGRLFRSAAIDKPEVRTALVRRLGVKTDLDLRKAKEAKPSADLPVVTVEATAYAPAVKDTKWLRKAFDVLLDEANYPIVFHCAKGADRTGTLAVAIELLLGVDEDDVAKDWQLTAVYNRNPLFESIRYDLLMGALAQLKGDTWQAKAEAWVRSAGVTDAEIAQFRERMIERPKIAFGLVSDTHICSPLAVAHHKGVPQSDEVLRAAFRWMAAEGVDAVVNAGDVTELGTLEEVSLYWKIFDAEFEQGRCRDLKRNVSHFSVWGNHDCNDASYMRRGVDWLTTNRADLIVGNYEKLNEKMTGVPFGDGTFARQIHGVWLAGVNWKNGADGAAAIDRIATAAGPSNACFFVKHSPALTPNEQSALARHPNCVRFTGHSHTPLTATNALTVANGSVWSVSGSTSACKGGGAQAAIVRVWEDGLTIDRREVKRGDRLGTVFTKGLNKPAFSEGQSASTGPVPDRQEVIDKASERGIFGEAKCFDANNRGAMALAIEGRYLYGGAGNEVAVYDISEPLKPRKIGEVAGIGGARQLVVQKGMLYVTTREYGLWVVDATDPAKPRIRSRFDTCELATGVDIAGDVCFCGQRQNGVEFIDVSNPDKPRHIAMRKTGESQSVVYRDGYLYSGEWGQGQVTVFDAHDMSQIRQIQLIDLYGYGDGVWLQGNYLYAARGHHAKHREVKGGVMTAEMKRFGGPAVGGGMGHGLDIFNVSDPRSAKRAGHVDFPPFFARGLDMWTPRTSGNLLVASQTHNGLFAVDISDKTKPRVIGRWVSADPAHPEHPSACIGSLAIGQGVVYAAVKGQGFYLLPCAQAKIEVFDKGALPKNANFREPYAVDESAWHAWRPKEVGQVRSVALKGDVAYVACGDAGLYTVEILPDNSGWRERGQVAGVEQCYDVSVFGDRLYTAEGTKGFGAFDISGETPREMARLPRISQERQLALCVTAVSDKHVFFSDRHGTDLFDVSRLPAFTHLMRGEVPCPGWDKYLMDRPIGGGRYIAVNGAHTSVKWFDVNAAKQSNETKVNRIGLSNGLCAFGDDLAIMSAGSGYRFLKPNEGDPEDGSKWMWKSLPKFKDQRYYPGIPRSDGRYVCFTRRIDRYATLYDFADPEEPKALAAWKFSGNPDLSVFHKGRVIIPCGYEGLLLQK